MKELFTQKQIQEVTQTLAHYITEDHKGDKTPVVMVGVLNGCFMFYADLVRNLGINIECDFMRVKSYIGKRKQGDIRIIKDLEIPIKNKHIYIVDDIFDSGNTMKAVVDLLKVKKPASINVVTLLKRKSTPKLSNIPQFIGFEIDDEWVIGYGCDNDKGFCRNYPSIFAL